MVQEGFEKTAALVLTTIVILTSVFFVPDWDVVGLQGGSTLMARCLYSFFHASIIHAAMNCWCLLGLVFVYHISWRQFLAAYVIAVIAPPFTLMPLPTVGLSVVCFALLGMLVPSISKRLQFVLCCLPMLVGGFFIPVINAKIHLYAFLAGLFVGFLNMPIQCRKK